MRHRQLWMSLVAFTPQRGTIPTMAVWKRIMFEGAITHWVPEELVGVITDDLNGRGCATADVVDSDEMFLDMPGMIVTSRPIRSFDLVGLKVNMPSEDFGDMMAMLNDCSLRGGCYYKLHGFHRCLVLTQEQRDELMRILVAEYPDAEAEAAAFYADRLKPSEALRQIAAKQSGRPIEEIPNLGGNKLDRFIRDDDKSGKLPN